MAQTLIIGGEALTAEQIASWRTEAPHIRLLNEYGPTETVVGCCVYEVQAEDPMSGSVPIGRPIMNTQLYILDAQLQPVPVGMTGELYIAGAGLARGYLDRADGTAERFLAHPWSAEPGARLYRSGDLARYRADGVIEYLGRNDQQVKLRGYRIALGEIEAALSQHPAVRESVVIVREESASQEKHLVGYVVAAEIEGRSSEVLRRYLQEKLPDCMIPTSIVLLDALPLSPNGKMDRQRLPWPLERERAPQQIPEEEWSPLEELLGQVWSEVLASGARRDAVFFAPGGHSLLATQVVATPTELLGIEVPVRAIFEAPVLQAFARRVEHELQGKQGLEVPPLLPMVRGEQPVPLSFAQQRLWFLDQLEPGNTAYLIPECQIPGWALYLKAFQQSLQAFVARHESLRTTFELYESQPVQVIHPAGTFLLPLVDLQGLTSQERERQAQIWRHEKQQPCDLQRGPLLRVRVLRLASKEHLLLITMHHIVSDGGPTRSSIAS